MKNTFYPLLQTYTVFILYFYHPKHVQNKIVSKSDRQVWGCITAPALADHGKQEEGCLVLGRAGHGAEPRGAAGLSTAAGWWGPGAAGPCFSVCSEAAVPPQNAHGFIGGNHVLGISSDCVQIHRDRLNWQIKVCDKEKDTRLKIRTALNERGR